ncbi:MAG TPA: TlpA disulfide reductase family protein, partial [Flavisolibacter sp.]|nr:TlpA disulfide reductase family protein [Flavisolibacter sp.]
SLQKSKEGQNLKLSLQSYTNSKIGKLAPFFQVRDYRGEILSLKSFRNKQYVLLVFWASWCVPCREEFPELKSIYKSYHHKGLEIIAASIDKDVKAWKSTIESEHINQWWQFLVDESKPRVSSMYFVNGVPLIVLIDKQGKIISRWIGYSQANLDSLIKEMQLIFLN